MHNILQRSAVADPGSAAMPAARQDRALIAGWREGLSIVNLRGNAEDPAFCAAASEALGLELPVRPCTSAASTVQRAVWAGPDDWFVLGSQGQAAAVAGELHSALAGIHHAVTDVSSGYTVLQMRGASAREVLAQGCALDLHPRAFNIGQSAGTQFFKASIWLWQIHEAPVYEVLVRRSFMNYFWMMLEHCTQECGLARRAAGQ